MASTNTKLGYVFGGVAVITAAFLFTAVMPSFGQSTVDENVQTQPASEEPAIIVESEDAFPWPPINQPSTGKPVMRAVELQTNPDSFNKVNLEDAEWLQNAVDRTGERVDMTDEMVQDYFRYYEEVNNHGRYFEVTFSDGTVKYYAVSFTEVP